MLYKFNSKELLNIDNVVLIYLLVPAIDVATGFFSLILGSYAGYNMTEKMITLLPGIIVRAVLFLMLMKRLLRYNHYALIVLMGLLSVFFVTELVSLFNHFNANALLFGTLYIYKMIFILMVLFYLLYSENEKVSENSYLIVINTVIWYSLAIIIGHFSGMEYKTYGGMGSSGFLIAGSANSASLAFLIAAPFILSKMYYSRKIKERIFLLCLYLFLISAAMLLLTKVSIMSLFGMLFVYTYYVAKRASIVKSLFILTFFIIAMFAIYHYTQDSNFIKRIVSVYHYTDGNIIRLLFGGREMYIDPGFNMFVNDFSAYQQLFGAGAYEVRVLMANYTGIKQGIEVDFADIITKYGIVGFVLYYSIFILILLKAIKHIIFSKNIERKLFSFSYVFMFFISNVAGHVFVSGLMGFLIPLLIIKIIPKKGVSIQHVLPHPNS